jgi:hypothetical protein
MSTSTLVGNLNVTGHLRPGSITIPVESIGNSEIDGGRPIDADKQIHQYNVCVGDPRATSIATTTGRFLYMARGSGDITEFSAGVIVAGVTWAGGGQAVVDLLKNGVSAVSSTITIDGSTAALEAGEQGAGFSSTAYTDGDVFEVVITVTAGTGTVPKGFYCALVVRENADP